MPKKNAFLSAKNGYNAHALFYDQKSRYLDSFEQKNLLPNLGAVKGKKILDVGAGTGRIAVRLAQGGADVTAVDISEEMLKVLKRKAERSILPASSSVIPASSSVIPASSSVIPAKAGIQKEKNKSLDPWVKPEDDNGLTTIVADAEHLPFPNNSFDIVIAAFLIVHLKDLKYFFSEAYRVLKPGGILAVTNINQKRPPELKTAKGKIIIESYYHRPEAVLEELKQNLFTITKNILVKEKDVWINQIIVAKK